MSTLVKRMVKHRQRSCCCVYMRWMMSATQACPDGMWKCPIYNRAPLRLPLPRQKSPRRCLFSGGFNISSTNVRNTCTNILQKSTCVHSPSAQPTGGLRGRVHPAGQDQPPLPAPGDTQDRDHQDAGARHCRRRAILCGYPGRQGRTDTHLQDYSCQDPHQRLHERAALGFRPFLAAGASRPSTSASASSWRDGNIAPRCWLGWGRSGAHAGCWKTTVGKRGSRWRGGAREHVWWWWFKW